MKVKPGDIFTSKYGHNLYLVVEPSLLKGLKKGELMAMLVSDPPVYTFKRGTMFRFDQQDVMAVAADVQFTPVEYEDVTKQWPRGRPFVVCLDGKQEMVICAAPLDITGEEDLMREYDSDTVDVGLFDMSGNHLVCEGMMEEGFVSWDEYEVYDIATDQAA